MTIKKHHRKFSALVLFSVVILVLINACNPGSQQSTTPTAEPVLEQASEQSPAEIKIGYCPTMAPYVQALAETRPYVTPVLYDNSAVAMQALQTGSVQAILIGRAAWSHELVENLRLVLLSDGLTLIVQQPGVIRYGDLEKVRIFTHEDRAAIQDLLPAQTDIIFFDDFDQMRAAMDGSVAVLLRWSQVSPVDNLLVPVDAAGLKIPGFRSPHFYYLAPNENALTLLLDSFDRDG